MDEALKPCPAECLHTVDRGGPSLFRRRGDIFGVYCQTCQCSTEYYSTEAEAIAAWNTRADAAPTPKADEVEAVARAIKSASCPGREGPFGGYDYGHNEAFYGPAPEGGRYVIRDFRDPSSPDWGAWLHQTNDRDEHESMFARMTDDHVAQAAIAALDAVRGDSEPVAWLYEHPEGYYNTTTRRDDPSLPTYRGWIETPLYAHPPRGDQVARVVEWLRKDADQTEIEAGHIVKNSSGNPRKNAAEWAMLVAMKRGLADAIERGEPFNG